MTLSATLVAFAAAALYAVGAAFEHRGMADVHVLRSLHPGAVVHFLGAMFRVRVWWVGAVADVSGFGLHGLALRLGPLTLVQPVLVSGVVFALALRTWLSRRRPERAELVWAGVLAVGLVLFLTVATPVHASSNATADVLPAFTAAVTGVALLGGCVLVALRYPSQRALALGIGSGLVYAGAAGLLKGTVASDSVGAAIRGWPLWTLLAVSAAGTLLKQIAYQAGPLRLSLPAITVVNPVGSVALGVVVFDEQFRVGAAAVSAECLGLLLILVAAAALTRQPDRAPTDAAAPATPFPINEESSPNG